MLQQVLVPLDGSAVAESILPHAERFARLTGSTLTLLHVVTDVERSQTQFWVATAPAELRQSWEQAALTDTQRYLAALATRLQTAGLAVRTEVRAADDAAAAIVAYAQQEPGVVLVAMATHGRGGLALWVLGSVATKVLRAAPKPLLLVRAREDAAPVSMAHYRTIAVPLDGSELAEQALAQLQRIPIVARATLVLIGVTPERPDGFKAWHEPAASSMPDALDSQPERYESYLRRVAQRLETSGFTVRTRLVSGVPADTILRLGFEEHADLIVMATHGRSGMSRMALGSVAEQVIRNADLPVVLVRPSAVTSIGIAPDDSRQTEACPVVCGAQIPHSV
jgi:nucleotide-binding universal stress UspA family protein